MTYRPDPNKKSSIQCEDLLSQKDRENIEQITEKFSSEKELFNGKIIDLAVRMVKLPNGNEASREIIYHSGAAAVVPIDSDGNITLVRQHRSVIGKITLEIPAGKMDKDNEDPLECATRELEEETGLRSENFEHLITMDTTPGFCTEWVAIYLATQLSQHDMHTDEDEFLNVVKIPLDQAVERVKSGELSDAKTALGIMMTASKLGLKTES